MRPLHTNNLLLKRYFYIFVMLNIVFIASVIFLVYPISIKDLLRLEVTRNGFVVEQMLERWQIDGLLSKVYIYIYLNFLYVPVYIAGLWIMCVLLTRYTRHEILIRAGRFFSYLLIVAGICDIIENFSLLSIVNNGINDWNLHLSYDMAATKFSILIVTFLLLLVSSMFILLNKWAPGEEKNYLKSKL